MLHGPTFDLNIFKWIRKNLKDCEELSCYNQREIIKDDGFQWVLVTNKGGKKEDQNTLFVKYTCEVLAKVDRTLCESGYHVPSKAENVYPK